jgi:hypothetical protein
MTCKLSAPGSIDRSLLTLSCSFLSGSSVTGRTALRLRVPFQAQSTYEWLVVDSQIVLAGMSLSQDHIIPPTSQFEMDPRRLLKIQFLD